MIMKMKMLHSTKVSNASVVIIFEMNRLVLKLWDYIFSVNSPVHDDSTCIPYQFVGLLLRCKSSHLILCINHRCSSIPESVWHFGASDFSYCTVLVRMYTGYLYHCFLFPPEHYTDRLDESWQWRYIISLTSEKFVAVLFIFTPQLVKQLSDCWERALLLMSGWCLKKKAGQKIYSSLDENHEKINNCLLFFSPTVIVY